MMNSQLVEIQPRELKFIFELKKQTSCSVRLANNTLHYVAFKIKTTSPKKYCVRPNVGVIPPKSSSDFTVTMQAQAVAPPDMVCKDKFLIQSAIVRIGTTDKDITADTFAKDDGRYIQEDKLRVTLVSPPNSPILSPINGTLKSTPASEASVLKDPVVYKSENRSSLNMSQDAKNMDEFKVVNGVEFKTTKVKELKPRNDIINSKELNPAQDEDLDSNKDYINGEKLKPEKDQDFQPRKNAVDVEELKPVSGAVLQAKEDVINNKELQAEQSTRLNLSKELVNGEELQATQKELNVSKEVEFKTTGEEIKLVKDIEVMKSKLYELESKLRVVSFLSQSLLSFLFQNAVEIRQHIIPINLLPFLHLFAFFVKKEAEVTISKLGEERKLSFQERKILQGEVEMLRSKAIVKRVQVGFPLLFVCMVAIISFVLGSRLVP